MKILENNSWDLTKLIGKLRCLPSVVYRYMLDPYNTTWGEQIDVLSVLLRRYYISMSL
jgi:hypothetical protein